MTDAQPLFAPGRVVRLKCGGPGMTVLYVSKKVHEGSDENPFKPADGFLYSLGYIHDVTGYEQIVVPETALTGLN